MTPFSVNSRSSTDRVSKVISLPASSESSRRVLRTRMPRPSAI